MKRNIAVYIEDILESIIKIEEYTKGIGEEDFNENAQLQDAIMRRLEIIGEAVKNIPSRFRDKHPDLPWKEIAGMRDVLIHAYFGINIARVWNVVVNDIPDMKDKILKIKEDFED
ncbi:MAG: DUF86 domain-containing protein [Nanoarchaeota archaeon]|nr:DUF86 domain-containing protein [Nanoarchaeota archaeon]MCK5629468.1 DUF86 domain-containing protein [Nanoarchaeota archaeon]